MSDERVNPSDWDNYAIREASKSGHFEVVKLLLSDERVRQAGLNDAINLATRNGYSEIVDILKASTGIKRYNLRPKRQRISQ